MPRRVDGEDADRDLEDDAAGEQGLGEESVVVLGLDLDVELGVVEVEQELGRRRQDDEVAEGDAGDEQRRDQQQQRAGSRAAAAC